MLEEERGKSFERKCQIAAAAKLRSFTFPVVFCLPLSPLTDSFLELQLQVDSVPFSIPWPFLVISNIFHRTGRLSAIMPLQHKCDTAQTRNHANFECPAYSKSPNGSGQEMKLFG